MRTKIFLLILVVTMVIGTSFAVDYCDIHCDDNQRNITYNHTLCQYTPQPKSGLYGYKVISYGLSKEEKESIVNLHNTLRKKVARGDETRGNPGPQPAAKRMPDLVWDDELELIAQRWANQSQYGHDECRNLANLVVGQNVGKHKRTLEVADPNGIVPKQYQNMPEVNISALRVEEIVQEWYDYVVHWNGSRTKEPFREREGDNTGAYAYLQIVWAKTKKIACGALRFGKGPYLKKLLLVCNYGPSGNFPGKRIYTLKTDSEEEVYKECQFSLLKEADNIDIKQEVNYSGQKIVYVKYMLNGLSKSQVPCKIPAGAEEIIINQQHTPEGIDIFVKYYMPEKKNYIEEFNKYL